MNEVGRFFHRVGTVRHHETVVLLTVLVDRLDELQPNVVGHVLRTDLNDLLRRDVGDVSQSRNSSDQVVHRDLSGRVSRTRSGLTGTGDRTARSEHFDVRQCQSGRASGNQSRSQKRLLHVHGNSPSFEFVFSPGSSHWALGGAL